MTNAGSLGHPGVPAVVELAAASYTYPGPPPVTALRPADLCVRHGDHVSLSGPSGSGKSTLLNLIGLIDRPTRGSIRIDGLDMTQASERDRTATRARRIGFVFQSYHLLPHRTAIENVMLAQLYAEVPRRQRLSMAMDALREVGLGHRTSALPTAMSGGERQRVAIARALVNRPALMLCDEPTGSLDSATTTEVLEVLSVLNRAGMTLFVVTHDPAVAARARRRLTIRDGTLAEERPGQAARSEPGPPAARMEDAHARPLE